MNIITSLTLCISIIAIIQSCGALDQNGSCSADTNRNKKFVICNVGLWYINFRFEAKYIDPYLCTHISTSYFELELKVNPIEVKIVMPGTDDEKRWKIFQDIVQLKRIKPDLQILASVGGWTDLDTDARKYYRLESTPLMEAFLSQAARFLRKHGLDGIEFVWNFIGRGKSISDDSEQLAKIASTLCKELQKNGYLCMITLIGASKYDLVNPEQNRERKDKSLKSIIKDADIVGIWTADLSPQEGFFHSDMLSAPPGANKIVAEHTVENVLNFYTKTLGLSSSHLRKLGMVIPMQTNGLKNSGGYTDLSLGSNGDITQDHSLYNQISHTWICERLNNIVHDDLRLSLKYYGEAPFAISADQKVYFSYNTRDYVKKKVRFAKESGIGGIVIFQIGADNFLGQCENRSMPLLSAINEEITGNC